MYAFLPPAERRAQLRHGDVVVGYLRGAAAAFEQLGIPPPSAIDFPDELADFYGRRIWTKVLSQVAN